MSMVKIYQADAFTNRLFGGNPAAVVPLESWLDDKTLQSVAMENNLAETAYICLLYTSPSPRDGLLSRMPSSA